MCTDTQKCGPIWLVDMNIIQGSCLEALNGTEVYTYFVCGTDFSDLMCDVWGTS
jgi:hypothetical protein